MTAGDAVAPDFPEIEVVLELHDAALMAHGGAGGVRDSALVESALARPLNRFLYADERDLHILAAEHAFGIARNHPFVDGNKRTAWAACVLFLELNGVPVPPDPPDAVAMVERLAKGEAGVDEFAQWLRGLGG